MASIGSLGKPDGGDINKMVVSAAVPVRSTSSMDAAGHSQDASARISSTGKLQSTLTHLAETTRKLSQPQVWQATRAQSSAPDVIDVTTQTSEPDQKIDVHVDQIASAQTAMAAVFSPMGTTIGLGTLNIEVGSWNSSFSSFTTNPNWPKARVMTGPGDPTVERLRDKINGAGMGVIANVISDSTGTYLILKAASTGSQNGFRVTVEPDAATPGEQAELLKRLSFNPPEEPQGMALTQAAQDAQLRVNGQTVTSPGNFIEDLAPGVDATLKQASPEAVRITVKHDPSEAQMLVEDFVRTYNDLQGQLSQASQAHPGTLQSAQAAQSALQTQMSQDNSPLKRDMAQLGISMKADGQLELNGGQLAQQLATQSVPPASLGPLLKSWNQSGNDTMTPPEPRLSAGADSTSDWSNTSPLFRQALVGQYTNNLYAEDLH